MAGSAARASLGLAPDVDLVGRVDQIGAALPVADEHSEQRRSKVTNCVHVLLAFGCGYTSEQVVDQIPDLRVFLGEASYRAGKSRRAFKEISVCLLYTSPSPRDRTRSRMPSSA